jgi:tripartite-type tricarboxylate transporter receptor subunit TctC
MRNALKTALLFAWFLPACLALQAHAAESDGYPSKPVRMVSPFAAGGSNDTVARIVAIEVSRTLGQQIIVENRPGAGGAAGTDFVAKAPADGYTLLSGGMGSLTVGPSLKKLPYNTLTDFMPVALIGRVPHVLAAHPSLPVTSMKEFIALARKNPGKLHYSSGGVGSFNHLAGELIASMTKTRLVHVSYRGGAPAAIDLLAGQVELSVAALNVAMPHLQTRRLRALGQTGAKRSSMLPDVPSIAETVPGYDVTPWYGVLAPAKTPAAVVSRLEREFLGVLRKPDVQEKFRQQGAEPTGLGSAQYRELLKTDLQGWKKIVTDAGIKLN